MVPNTLTRNNPSMTRQREIEMWAIQPVAATQPGTTSVAPHSEKGEEHMSLFWRIFGGTIISVIALVGVTLYNHWMGTISELRHEVARLNEARADLIKKDELNSRTDALGHSIQELQVSTSGLREQIGRIAEKKNSLCREGEQLRSDLTTLKDRQSGAEQKLKLVDEDHKTLQQVQTQIATLIEKNASRDVQLKMAEDERRELLREMQLLRDRLSRLEGKTELTRQ